MTLDTGISRVAKRSPWRKYFWAFLILVAILAAIYFATKNEWSWKKGATPVAAQAVVTTSLPAASAPASAATASAPVCECKCDCCAKKPVVKKVVKKKPRPVKKQPVEEILTNKPTASAAVEAIVHPKITTVVSGKTYTFSNVPAPKVLGCCEQTTKGEVK